LPLHSSEDVTALRRAFHTRIDEYLKNSKLARVILSKTKLQLSRESRREAQPQTWPNWAGLRED
jgi:hypothetical protein